MIYMPIYGLLCRLLEHAERGRVVCIGTFACIVIHLSPCGRAYGYGGRVDPPSNSRTDITGQSSIVEGKNQVLQTHKYTIEL
jgi:hypothetical protein